MVCSGINEPAREVFDLYLRREHSTDAATYLERVLDIRSVAPQYIGPRLEPGMDIWGVRRKPVRYGAGTYHEIDWYPLAAAASVDDLRNHTWPDPDWFDYEVLSQQIDQANASGGRHAIMALSCNVFETSWYMRGFERAFMDLAVEPGLFDSIMVRVADFCVEYARRTLEAAGGGIDLIFTADDIGQQNGLLMSVEMWETHIKPHHVRINRVIHEGGAKVIYHSDGAVMQAVPGLVDMGIDVLQALQFDAEGMNPRRLKEQHGDRLCFEGGVSVQRTLPFGEPEEVREEVEELISVLGQGGGYILGPSHAIQAGTPAQNIYAMFDAALHDR